VARAEWWNGALHATDVMETWQRVRVLRRRCDAVLVYLIVVGEDTLPG
jgi:hypothetical protein